MTQKIDVNRLIRATQKNGDKINKLQYGKKISETSFGLNGESSKKLLIIDNKLNSLLIKSPDDNAYRMKENVEFDFLFDDNHPASFANTELSYVYNPHIRNYAFHTSENQSPAAAVAAGAAAVGAVAAAVSAYESSRTAAAAERSAAAAERSVAASEKSVATTERSARWI